jgi:hypothetical protein
MKGFVMTAKWYDAYTMHMGVERHIRVTQAMYDMSPIEGVMVSEEGKLYVCPRDKLGILSYTLRAVSVQLGRYPFIRRMIGFANRNFRVHRIVACTLNPIENLDCIRGVPDEILKTAKRDPASMLYLYHSLQVNHINHDPSDYSPSNLEWCTAFENHRAYHEHAGFDKMREEKSKDQNEELEKFIENSRLDKRLRSYLGTDNVVTIKRFG